MRYDELEGVLGSLRERSAPTFARSLRTPRQPYALSARAERRVDVTMAMRRLPADDQQILLEHYVLGTRRVAPRVRRPAVKKLLAALRGV